MAAPTGEIRDGRVLVREERDANALYNKGAFGHPQSGGALELELVEALYLVEHNRLRVPGLAAGELLLRAAREEPGFETRYVVYRDLRARGLVTRASNVTDFNVYPAGALPGKTASKYLARALAERGALDPTRAAEDARRVAELGKRLLLSVVDDEGDLTHYAADLAEPAGKTPAAKRDFSAVEAALLADRAFVADAAGASALQDGEWFGRPVGPGLHVPFVEALYLAEETGLGVRDLEDRDVTPADLRERARRAVPGFDLQYAVYRDLKARQMVVKTGFKFGTHFRAYDGAPDDAHAPLLVHAVGEGETIPWAEVAGFVRLAHGVRKDVLFATTKGYLRLRRTRP